MPSGGVGVGVGGSVLDRRQAASEKDAIAYIDCIFHRRYARHLPLATLLRDMRNLKNHSVLGYVGAMPFCQRAFLRIRTHLYEMVVVNEDYDHGDNNYEQRNGDGSSGNNKGDDQGIQIYIHPKDYRDSVMNLVDYVNARTRTTLGDLYAFCRTAHPALVDVVRGSEPEEENNDSKSAGLLALRRFLGRHPALFEVVQPEPLERPGPQMEALEIRNSAALVSADVLLFPKVKIAVGRVVNIVSGGSGGGSTAYLECQGDFVSFRSSDAGLSATASLKSYLTKGDLVPFEARYSGDVGAADDGSTAAAASNGVSSTTKLRNVWKATAVELPRNPTSVASSTTSAANAKASSGPRGEHRPTVVVGYGVAPDNQPGHHHHLHRSSYLAPLDEYQQHQQWCRRRDSNSSETAAAAAIGAQNRDSSTSSLAAITLGPPGQSKIGGGMGGLLTPPFSTVFSSAAYSKRHSAAGGTCCMFDSSSCSPSHLQHQQEPQFAADAETQAGTGRPYVDKAVQTELTDEEMMLRLVRKFPGLLDNLK